MTDALHVHVRPGHTDDVRTLSELYTAGQDAIAGTRGAAIDTLLEGRQLPIDQSFIAELEHIDIETIVGLVDDVVVGYLSLDRSTADGVLATVTDLYVHPEARGVGVGAAMLDSAVELARSAGCTGLNARALPGDRVTKNFFESFGLVARSIAVYRALD